MPPWEKYQSSGPWSKYQDQGKAGPPLSAGDPNVDILAALPEKSITGFLANIPKSAGELVSNVAEAVTSPIKTFKGLGGLAAGAVEKMAPETFGTLHAGNVDNLVQHFKDRYGGWQQLADTAYKDPVGLAADVAAVVSGAGGAMRTIGKVLPESAVLVRAAETASTVGRLIDPIYQGSKVVAKTAKLGGRAVAGAAGILSDTNPAALRQAFGESSQAFQDAMRGKIKPTEILQNVKDAVQDVVNQRKSDLQSGMSQVSGAISKDPAKQAFIDALDEHGVKATIIKKGESQSIDINDIFKKPGKDSKVILNFDNSPIAKSGDISRIEDTFSELKRWGNTQVKGMDYLRRRIYDRISPIAKEAESALPVDRPVNNILQNTHDSLMSSISQVSPAYGETAAKYQESTKFLNEIRQDLLGSGNGNSIKRLQNASKESNEYQQVLSEALDTATAQKYNIRDKLMGYGLHDYKPKFFRAAAVLAPIMLGLGHGLSAPRIAELAATSPRFSGEFVNILGKGARFAGKISEPLAPMLRAPFYQPISAINQIPEQPPEIQ